ncbi:hypothetical protein ACFPRL_04885 [Pseudoclavibacter helvolus]
MVERLALKSREFDVVSVVAQLEIGYVSPPVEETGEPSPVLGGRKGVGKFAERDHVLSGHSPLGVGVLLVPICLAAQRFPNRIHVFGRPVLSADDLAELG